MEMKEYFKEKEITDIGYGEVLYADGTSVPDGIYEIKFENFDYDEAVLVPPDDGGIYDNYKEVVGIIDDKAVDFRPLVDILQKLKLDRILNILKEERFNFHHFSPWTIVVTSEEKQLIVDSKYEHILNKEQDGIYLPKAVCHLKSFYDGTYICEIKNELIFIKNYDGYNGYRFAMNGECMRNQKVTIVREMNEVEVDIIKVNTENEFEIDVDL